MGIEIKENFNVKDFFLLINSKKIIIKVDKMFNLFDFYIIFLFFFLKYKSILHSAFLIKISTDTASNNVIIQKKQILRLKLIIKNKLNLNYDDFILFLNENNEQNYYDSGTSFKGEMLGIEIRFKEEINLNKSETILGIYDLIQKNL